MKIKHLTLVVAISFAIVSCGGEKAESTPTTNETETTVVEEEVIVEDTPETSANENMDNKGVGPISSIELGDIDDALAATGKEIYKANCTACHKFGKKYIGPALKGVTTRRSPEWIMNMMLNPEGMVEEDPIAKALLEEYNAPMSNQQLSEEDARAILEFFRTKE